MRVSKPDMLWLSNHINQIMAIFTEPYYNAWYIYTHTYIFLCCIAETREKERELVYFMFHFENQGFQINVFEHSEIETK